MLKHVETNQACITDAQWPGRKRHPFLVSNALGNWGVNRLLLAFGCLFIGDLRSVHPGFEYQTPQGKGPRVAPDRLMASDSTLGGS